MKLRQALVSTLVCSALLLVACGGEDGGDTTQGTPLSKADFVAQVNKICADAGDEITAAAQERFGNSSERPSDEEINLFTVDVLVPMIEEQANAIDALGAPEGDDDEVDAIVAALRDGIDMLRDDPVNSEDAFGEANQLAGDYGLDDCTG